MEPILWGHAEAEDGLHDNSRALTAKGKEWVLNRAIDTGARLYTLTPG